jgi:hypothetical protein
VACCVVVGIHSGARSRFVCFASAEISVDIKKIGTRTFRFRYLGRLDHLFVWPHGSWNILGTDREGHTVHT